jgi:hypothetical protein
MKTVTIIIAVVTCINVFGATTGPLCDKEVTEHNQRRKIRSVPGRYVQRHYKKDAKSAFKLRHLYTETVKSEFCEALVNTVVRMKTAHLRQHVTASESNVMWVKSEKQYKIRYQGDIKERLLVREMCALTMPGMPELKTVNGQISDNHRISTSQLNQALALLSRDGLKIADVRVIVPIGQRRAAKEFIESLNLKGRSLICETAKGETQVLIKIKQR